MIIELFSHWIFIWFLLYYFNIINYNPVIYLLFAYLIIFITFAFIFLEGASIKNIIYFFIYNSIFKLIPMILIMKFPLIIYIKDILFGIYLLIIYLIYMILVNKNPFDYYKEYIEIFKNKEDNIKTFTDILLEDLNDIYNFRYSFGYRL